MQVIKKLYSQPRLLLGLSILLVFGLVAMAAPLLAPPQAEDPYLLPRDGFKPVPLPPNADHPLGTLPDQYDVFHGVVWGTRVAFRMGLLITAGRMVIGVVLGLIAGYYGGWLDNLLMRITDAFMAFPIMAVAVVALALFGESRRMLEGGYWLVGNRKLEHVLILTLIGFGWMQYARLVRGNVLKERSQEYVEAAVALGLPNRRIMARHVLPNVTQGLFVLVAADISAAVVLMAAFNFLGLSVTPNGAPTADWGQMLSVSRDWIIGVPGNPFGYWFTYLPPSLALLLFSVGWNLLGDGLRRALDPRLQGRQGVAG